MDQEVVEVDNSIIIASDVEEELPQGRKLRMRQRSESSDNGTKSKAMKKKKDTPGLFKSEKEAKKIYLNFNKKNVKVIPMLLETIFEEEEKESTSVQSKQLGKPHKRALTIKDGFNISKALINKRKTIIKKKFGSRKKPKKVALKKFIEDFKNKTSEFCLDER
jgi:hypothetical protein